jgi:hypothetical protein
MTPQDKPLLTKYTKAAEAIIYDAGRMRQFMKMLGTKEGALTAVHTVMAGIERVKPIPPQITQFLGVNIYMLMVDVAQESTGFKPDPGIVREVVATILQSVGQSHGQPAPAPAPAPAGIIAGQQQGVPA